MFISILTSTYNRGDLLVILYESLKKQTLMNFEWIIIDDGSVDNTEKIVQKWLTEEKNFKIKYFKVDNGGKHRAINLGVNNAIYDYIFIVDSDDYLINSAIEKVIIWLKTIENENQFVGVAGIKGYDFNNPVGNEILKFNDKQFIDASNLERKKYNLLGDKAEVYRKDILKKYRFPEFSGENFLTEASVWNKIASDGYKIRWFNEIIYICKYHENGLTKMGVEKEVNNFRGFTYYIKIRMENEKNIIKPLCSFSNIARMKGLSVREMSKILEINIFIMFITNLLDKIIRFNIKKYYKYIRRR